MSDNTKKQETGFSLSQWAQSDAAVYDRSEVYQAEIRGLVEQLHELCKQHKIPMHFIACYVQQADGSNRCHEVSSFISVEELPGEVLVRALPSGPIGPDTIKRVIRVIHADQMRIERFYENSGITH